MAAIIEKHRLWVVSDEIHCDLIRAGLHHTPMGKVMPDYDRLITCMSASKTFNLAGLMHSNIIIRDAEERARFQDRDKNIGAVNPLSIAAHKAAYEHGGPWLEQLKAYVDGNLAIVMLTWENGYAEPWASLTVDLDGERRKDCAFIDINGDADFPVWLIRHGLAIPTGATQRNGYCEYPEYRFRADRLRELDPEGYAEYLTLQEELHSEGRHSA